MGAKLCACVFVHDEEAVFGRELLKGRTDMRMLKNILKDIGELGVCLSCLYPTEAESRNKTNSKTKQ